MFPNPSELIVLSDDEIEIEDHVIPVHSTLDMVQVCDQTMNVLDESGYCDAILEQGNTETGALNFQPSGPISELGYIPIHSEQPSVSVDMERSVSAVNPVTPSQSPFSALTYMKRLSSGDPSQVDEDFVSMERVSKIQFSSVVNLSDKTVSPDTNMGSSNDDTSVLESQTPTVTTCNYLYPIMFSNTTAPTNPQSSTAESSFDQSATTAENLCENFQPTPILLKEQILGYKQVYVSPDPIAQTIKKIKKCPVCGCLINQRKSVVKVQEGIVEHLRTIHNLPGLPCNTCRKISIPEYSIPCICRTCDVCLEPFNMGLQFLNHVRKQHIKLKYNGSQSVTPTSPQSGNTFQCLISSSCSFSCPTDVIFAKHLASAHHVVTHKDPHNLILKCPLCSFKKRSINGLSAHIKKFHFALGSGKNMRDRKHKTISSSIFMFSENSFKVPSTDTVVGNVADHNEASEDIG